MGQEVCPYCSGSGKGSTRVARVGAEDQVITDPCMFCGGAGVRWEDDQTSSSYTPIAETSGGRSEPAEGLAGLLAVVCGIAVGAVVYQNNAEPVPALVAGGAALFISRAILKSGPVQALLRGVLWLVKIAIILGLVLGALTLFAGQ